MEGLKTNHEYKGMEWVYEAKHERWVCRTPIACLNIHACKEGYWLYEFIYDDEEAGGIDRLDSLEKAFEAAHKWLKGELWMLEIDVVMLRQYLNVK